MPIVSNKSVSLRTKFSQCCMCGKVVLSDEAVINKANEDHCSRNCAVKNLLFENPQLEQRLIKLYDDLGEIIDVPHYSLDKLIASDKEPALKLVGPKGIEVPVSLSQFEDLAVQYQKFLGASEDDAPKWLRDFEAKQRAAQLEAANKKLVGEA